MKVLIADDEPVSRRLLELSLRRWGYEVVVAGDGFEVSFILQQPDPPKLLLLDWLMPGLDGLELCRLIREQPDESYTYVLLLTSKRTMDDVVQGLDSGADDYLMKPFDPHELKARLRIGRRVLHLYDQLVAARGARGKSSVCDALTGLHNRETITEMVDTELTRARRESSSLGIMLVDVDQFEKINRTYGHPAGKMVLSAVAQALQSTVRSYDSVGRCHGEEFLIILPGCDAINAFSHAERVRVALSQLVIPMDHHALRVTASIGVAVADCGTRHDAARLAQEATQARDQAKAGGGNLVEMTGRLPAAWHSTCSRGIGASPRLALDLAT